MSACENKHIKELMGFQKDWNKEVIAQFYATVHFGHLRDDRAMLWMTEGKYYRVTFTQFIHVLGLDRHDANRPKIHNQPVLPNEEVKFMYPRGETGNAGRWQSTGHLPPCKEFACLYATMSDPAQRDCL